MKDETKEAIRQGFFHWIEQNPEIVARFFWFVVGAVLGFIAG